MKFNKGIERKYRRAIESAAEVIAEIGTDGQKRVMNAIFDSRMLICVGPVAEVRASGITGVIDPGSTNGKIADGRLSLDDSLGEIYITFAAETIAGAGARGTEGTLVHEAQHAFDFAKVIESFSKTDINPLGVFNPTLYELELAAHITSGEFMLRSMKDDYIAEGLDLGLIERSDAGYEVSMDGILSRLKNSYGLEKGGNEGPLASDMAGLQQR